MLKEYHSLRQRVVFEDDKSAEHDQNIQETTRSITTVKYYINSMVFFCEFAIANK